EHQDDLGPVPDRRAQFLEHGLEPSRARRIMEHREVDLASHDFAARHMGPAGGPCDQLLRECPRWCRGIGRNALVGRSVHAHSMVASLTRIWASRLPIPEISISYW